MEWQPHTENNNNVSHLASWISSSTLRIKHRQRCYNSKLHGVTTTHRTTTTTSATWPHGSAPAPWGSNTGRDVTTVNCMEWQPHTENNNNVSHLASWISSSTLRIKHRQRCDNSKLHGVTTTHKTTTTSATWPHGSAPAPWGSNTGRDVTTVNCMEWQPHTKQQQRQPLGLMDQLQHPEDQTQAEMLQQ